MAMEADLIAQLTDRKILLVDDERFSRSIVARALAEVETVQAGDGAEALHALIGRDSQYSLVICDFNMPVIDGLRFLKAVRSGMDGIRHTLPVIMLTGNSDSGLVKAALQLDVDAFVLKPVAVTPLHGRIRHVLSQKPDLKTPQYYAGINVEDVSKQLLSAAAALSTEIAKRDEDMPPVPGARHVTLADIPPGALLARDIRAAAGQVLVAEGATLSERLINRLRELKGMGVCPDTLWVVE